MSVLGGEVLDRCRLGASCIGVRGVRGLSQCIRNVEDYCPVKPSLTSSIIGELLC